MTVPEVMHNDIMLKSATQQAMPTDMQPATKTKKQLYKSCFLNIICQGGLIVAQCFG